jgi:hypothetical protein
MFIELLFVGINSNSNASVDTRTSATRFHL